MRCAELIGFIHIMRSQQNRQPLGVESADAFPQEQARLGIEIIGRLVQKQNVGRVHQRARNHQPLRHSTGVAVNLFMFPVAQPELIQ